MPDSDKPPSLPKPDQLRLSRGDFVKVFLPFTSYEGEIVTTGESSVSILVWDEDEGAPSGKIVSATRAAVELHDEGRPLPDDLLL